MTKQEVIYADGSMSTFDGHGGSFHEGTGITRLRLLTAKQALEVYLKWEGKMQLTRDGHRAAVINIIEPLSGKQFTTASGKVTMAVCRKALEECKRMLADLEGAAVIVETEES
jgi:hypothetical protein